MDRAKSKKIRNIRVIATNIFMCISVVVIVFILMLIAMGFSFNETGKFEQFGYVQLVSRPSDASVSIDNKSQFGHTELSKLLSGGNHAISITKQGYDTWSQNLKVDAGLLTRVDWIRLFPTNPEISNITTIHNLRFASFSPNRKYLITASKTSPYLYRYQIQDDEPHSDKIPLDECLGSSKEQADEGAISIVAWNDNNNKIIAKWSTDNKKYSWHIFDLERPKNSINLTEKYGFNFDIVLAANSSASKLWALENGNLRLIDTSNSTAAAPIAKNVIKIAHNHDTVSFIAPNEDVEQTSDDTTIYSLNTYREGEDSHVHITDLDDFDKNTATIKLAMGGYWNEDWLAYSINKHFTVLSGKYPSYSKSEKKNSLKKTYEQELNEEPELASFNPPQRVIVLAGNNSITSYDIETKTSYNYNISTPLTSINWLDDYLLWRNSDNEIIIRDFDGNNRRKVASSTDNPFPVIISENNRYLYYFDAIKEETTSDPINTPSDSDSTTTTEEAATKHILKRIKLQ